MKAVAAERPFHSDRPGRRSSGLPSEDRRRALGAHGESLAARWYEGRGYDILERNWRRRQGEVDLVVRRGSTVVFCEVKVRSNDRFGTGAEAVSVAKQRRIRHLATVWLNEHDRAPAQPRGASLRERVELRFDVVAVTGGRVEVIQAAF